MTRLMIGAAAAIAAVGFTATPALSQIPPSGIRSAAGGLMVAPTRLVFEGSRRSAEITLLNTGAAPTTYRFSFVQMRMREDGSFEEIQEPRPGELFADPLVRYSPRQVTLEPHVPQTIRIQLRKPAGLPPGEYRSHLLFRALPSSWTASRENEDRAGIQIELTPIYGISIPVIVRHGETWASARLADLGAHMDPVTGAATVGFTIHRQGTRSLYGDVSVELVSPEGGREEVARMKGVAVYAPNALRRLMVRLPGSGSHAVRGGRLRVIYTSLDSGEQRAVVEAVLP